MIDQEYFEKKYSENRLKYITAEEKANYIEMCAETEGIVTPSKPPYSIDSRVNIINADFFTAEDLFGHSDDISSDEFFALQMRRIGLDLGAYSNGDYGNTDIMRRCFKEPVLAVFGMMESGLVTTADMGTTETHIYTRNIELVRRFCGNVYANEMQRKILDNFASVQKNYISCFEIFPDKSKSGKWYCEPVLYIYRPEQTITYTLSILAVRRKILSKLFDGMLELEYFDIATQTVKKIITSLNNSMLSPVTEESLRVRILDELCDDRHMASLRLPILGGESNGTETTEVFIPAIIYYQYHATSGGWHKGYDPFEEAGVQ